MFPADLHTPAIQDALATRVDPVVAAQGAQAALHYATYMQAADPGDKRRPRWVRAAREGVCEAATALGLAVIDPNDPAAVRAFIDAHANTAGVIVLAGRAA